MGRKTKIGCGAAIGVAMVLMLLVVILIAFTGGSAEEERPAPFAESTGAAVELYASEATAKWKQINDVLELSGFDKAESSEIASSCAKYRASGWDLGNLPLDTSSREAYIIGNMSVILSPGNRDRFCRYQEGWHFSIQRGRMDRGLTPTPPLPN